MKRNLVEAGIFSGFLFLWGCTSPSSTSSTPTGSPKEQASSMVVFHTSTGVFTTSASALSPEKLKEIVDNFYPAACFDRDSDDDETPDALDDDCDEADGGSRSSRDDDGDEDDDDDDDDDDLVKTHRCEKCNRGPGTEGDFRFEVKGDRAELDRGRVLVSAANSVEVPGPNGAVTIIIDAKTELRGGIPTPGSEIRAEGTLQGAATGRTFVASRLEVLCPGPTPMPAGSVPPDATPVPTTGADPSTVPDAGAFPQIN